MGPPPPKKLKEQKPVLTSQDEEQDEVPARAREYSISSTTSSNLTPKASIEIPKSSSPLLQDVR